MSEDGWRTKGGSGRGWEEAGLSRPQGEEEEWSEGRQS